MRELSKSDKEIIDRIIECSNSNNLGGLQVANLLRKELKLFAVTWDTEKKDFVIYAPNEDNNRKNNENYIKDFFDIIKFLSLIEDLINEGYVKPFESSIEIQEEDLGKLYDRNIYKFKDGVFWNKDKNTKTLFAKKVDYSKFRINIVDFLDKYAYLIIFPLNNLIAFKKRGYRTENQVFNRRNIRAATWAAIFAGIAAGLTAYSTFTTQEIEVCNEVRIADKVIAKPDTVAVIDTICIPSDTCIVKRSIVLDNNNKK